MDLEALRALIDDRIRASGVLEKLDRVGAFMVATDAAFALIEADPHQWSNRPCSTCETVSRLIGRPFGCQAKR